MALAELVGLGVAVIVTIGAYSATHIVCAPKRISHIAIPSGSRQRQKNTTVEEAEFYLQFDKIFTLRMKSKSSARLFQIGMLAVLFAVAFLIITYGLRNLGF